jgi:hypothetical protein
VATAESNWIREWVGPAALIKPAQAREPGGRGFLAHAEFGLYVWNNGRFRCTLRCGPVGQNGNGGHAHSDQLAITLDMDGQAVAIDPGTAIYTPNPNLRNRFRSAAAHSGIVIPNMEPNEWLPGRWGLFAMKDRSQARMLSSDPDGAVAMHQGYGLPIRRTIHVTESTLEIIDDVPQGLHGAFAQLVLSPGVTYEIGDQVCRLMVPGYKHAVMVQVSGGLHAVEMLASPRYGVVTPAHAIRWPIGKVRIG